MKIRFLTDTVVRDHRGEVIARWSVGAVVGPRQMELASRRYHVIAGDAEPIEEPETGDKPKRRRNGGVR